MKSASSAALAVALIAVAALSYWLGRRSVEPGSEGGGADRSGDYRPSAGPNPAGGSAASPTALQSGGTGRASDPAGRAAAAALLDSSVRHSFEHINEQVNAMSTREMARVFRELREGGGHPQRALIEDALVYQLIGRDPAAMIDLKLAYPDLPVLGRTYRNWAQVDPEAALAHVIELENETWYRQGMNAIFSGIGTADPQRALAALNAAPEAQAHHYSGVFRGWASYAGADAAAAIGEVPDQFRPAAIASLADNWPESDPDAARAWVEGLPAEQAAVARPVFERRIAQLKNRIEFRD